MGYFYLYWGPFLPNYFIAHICKINVTALMYSVRFAHVQTASQRCRNPAQQQHLWVWWVKKNELTWDPSGLLLPAGPGVRTFTAVAVLLAMLVATGKVEAVWRFTRGKTAVCLCLYVYVTVQDGHRCDGWSSKGTTSVNLEKIVRNYTLASQNLITD